MCQYYPYPRWEILSGGKPSDIALKSWYQYLWGAQRQFWKAFYALVWQLNHKHYLWHCGRFMSSKGDLEWLDEGCNHPWWDWQGPNGRRLPATLFASSFSEKSPILGVAGTPDTAGSLTTEIATTDFVAVSQNLHQLLQPWFWSTVYKEGNDNFLEEMQKWLCM